jgi:hypothetical protein
MLRFFSKYVTDPRHEVLIETLAALGEARRSPELLQLTPATCMELRNSIVSRNTRAFIREVREKSSAEHFEKSLEHDGNYEA